jgi:hypothetical protein
MPLPPIGADDGYGFAAHASPYRPGIEEEIHSQAWMFGIDDDVLSPWQFEKPDGPTQDLPPPTQEDFDRAVQEAMAAKLSERADLRKRVERVHNNGELDDEESINVAFRALWAVPLVLIANGINALSKPLYKCCSMTVTPPVGRAAPSAKDIAFWDEARPGAEEPSVRRMAWCEPQLPSAAREICGVAGKPDEKDTVHPVAPKVEVEGASPQPLPEQPTPSTDASVKPSVTLTPVDAVASGDGPAGDLPVIAEDASAEGSMDAQPKPKPKKPKGDRASAISVGGNINSGVGGLLSAYAKNGAKPAKRSAGDRASAVGLSTAGQSAASAALASAASGGLAPSKASESAGTDGSAGEKAALAKPRRKPGQSGSVVSTNLQSGSATSNLLGPMMAKQSKKKASRAADTASAIG